jgi:hypothetical protein
VTASLVIAATTEVLRYIVDTAVQRAFDGIGSGTSRPAVTTGAPPNSAASDATDPPTVNLFLYRVSPNIASRNKPGRDRLGVRPPDMPTALDFEYLVSAHGPAVENEIGLAAALDALHQTAIVPPSVIREALQRLVSHTNPVLRAVGSDDQLIDTLEGIQISSSNIDLDAITRLWIAAQAPLRLSACYQVTPVFRDPRSTRN